MSMLARAFLEQAGLTFAAIPAGTYPVGASGDPQDLLTLVPQRTWDGYPLTTPPQTVTSAGFAISTQPLRLSHWYALRERVDAYALRMRFEIEIDEATLAALAARQVETDAVLEVSFGQAEDIAIALGATLPTWSEWEIATRGSAGRRYPWGDTLERSELGLELQDYSIDTESEIGFYSHDQYLWFIQSFGRYADAVSPFGLGGLARIGGEWNRVPPGTLPAGTGDRIWRSLSDTGAMLYMMPGIRPNTWDSERWLPRAWQVFSGPMLACYTPPTIARPHYQAAGFRLVLPS